MKKSIILLSGGLDSATCLAYAHSKNQACYALSFNYGQKHLAELIAAQRLAKEYQVLQHQIINLPAIAEWGGSALTNENCPVPDYSDTTEIPITYVPARNTIMLSMALGFAEVLHADYIYLGVSSVDYSGYPDCRPEYIQAFTQLANLATKRGVEGHPIMIETPLMDLSKSETIQLGLSLGLDYSKTISCYRATDSGLACGQCDSCHLRKKGFEEAQVVDPTHYLI